MEAVLRIFRYIKGHLKAKVVFDLMYHDWTSQEWSHADWKEFYPDAQEPISHKMPELAAWEQSPSEHLLQCSTCNLFSNKTVYNWNMNLCQWCTNQVVFQVTEYDQV